jgi:hypothetical protein
MSPPLVNQLIEPFVIGCPQEAVRTVPKFDSVLRTHMGIECLQVRKGIEQLKMVRRRRLAEQGERLNASIV